MSTFKDESANYFKTAGEVEVFEHVYREVLKEMCSENIADIITSLTKSHAELIVNKNEVANTVIGLRYAGVLGTCSQRGYEGYHPDRRIYFCDAGKLSARSPYMP